jgi:molecular chaperone GrpE (heat shock protein)
VVVIAKEEGQSNDTPEEQAVQEQESQQAGKEQLLRLAAEFDNYKKRVKKDIEGAESNGKAITARRCC